MCVDGKWSKRKRLNGSIKLLCKESDFGKSPITSPIHSSEGVKAETVEWCGGMNPELVGLGFPLPENIGKRSDEFPWL